MDMCDVMSATHGYMQWSCQQHIGQYGMMLYQQLDLWGNTMSFSVFAQDGIAVFGKVHTCTTPPQQSPLETGPGSVWLNIDCSCRRV